MNEHIFTEIEKLKKYDEMMTFHKTYLKRIAISASIPLTALALRAGGVDWPEEYVYGHVLFTGISIGVITNYFMELNKKEENDYKPKVKSLLKW